MDPNYDELDNSIVESLSEMSIASTAMMNAPTHDLIHRTITEVISAFLWAADFNFSSVSSEDEIHEYPQLVSRVKSAWDSSGMAPAKKDSTSSQSSSLSKGAVHEIDFDNDTTPKPSPRKGGSSAQPSKTGSNRQIEIPALNFSSLVNNDELKTRNNNTTESKKFTLNSKLNDAKKKEFGTSHDSHFKKNVIKNIKADIKSYLKELKFVKSTSIPANEYYDENITDTTSMYKNDKFLAMENDLKELLSRLLDKRRLGKRIHDIDKMSREEVLGEKVDTQKELLSFEGKHGRPVTKLDKDLMRPLYDHYRKVKRLLNNKNGHDVNGDGDDPFNHDDKTGGKDQLRAYRNLHSLKLNELLIEKDQALQEKAKLKDIIKKHESDFMQINGRPLQKEDREFYKEDYEKYKAIKSKIKLVEALIEKHKIQTDN